MSCHNLLRKLNVSPLGDFWRFALDFLQSSPHVSFPFPDFALYHFIVINHIHEYDYTLSPGSPPKESSRLRMVLGTLDIAPIPYCLNYSNFIVMISGNRSLPNLLFLKMILPIFYPLSFHMS